MSFRRLLAASLASIVAGAVPVGGQTLPGKDSPAPDFSKESAVAELTKTRVVFQNDGSYVNEQYVRVGVQSDAGVRQFGVIPLPYREADGHLEVRNVRVIKPNGTVVETDLSSIQDVTSEISKLAPMYSDMREKHVPVKGLEPGDTMEYSVRNVVDKPLIPGQIWASLAFQKNLVDLDEQVEVSVPRDREIKVKSSNLQPTMHEEGDHRTYNWRRSNLESRTPEKQKEENTYDAMRGQRPLPDVLISSFRSWEEVGRWYDGLQRDKIQPSPEIKAKAEELTKGLTDDAAKVRAIYNYVSLRYRYISIGFGVGRYKPHAATEVLENQYGDCKDKHTLLAALLDAIGIRAYPALINSQSVVDPDVPSPAQFDHVVSAVPSGGGLLWMDTTPEVTTMGYLMPQIRGKAALVIAPDKIAFWTTPADSTVPNKDVYSVTAKLDDDGTLRAHSVTVFRGDSEVYFRNVFRRVPESQWNDYAQRTFYGGRLGGTVSKVEVSPPEKTDEPFTLSYDYTLKDFFGGDKHRFVVPLSPLNLPEIKDEDTQRKTPLWLGYADDFQYESRIELPKGWSASELSSLELKESFAEFRSNTELQNGVVVTKRTYVIKADGVSADQFTSYKAFRKAVSDNYAHYIFVYPLGASGTSAAGSMSKIWSEAEIADFRSFVSRISATDKNNALQVRTDTAACMVREEQEHWMHLHPEALGRKADTAKLGKCLREEAGRKKKSFEDLDASYDRCLRKAYGLPKPKE